MDEPTLSVTELNTTIRDAIRGAVPENVWVRGEVQGFRESRAGHVYFQLVEKDERRNRVQAALDVALFRSHLMTVHAALRKVPGVELADDVEVRVKGHIDVYPPTGRLQLIMTGIDPVFTAGALAANRDRVLRQLEAEGLPARQRRPHAGGGAAAHRARDQRRQRRLPRLPRRARRQRLRVPGRRVRRARAGRQRAAPGRVGAASARPHRRRLRRRRGRARRWVPRRPGAVRQRRRGSRHRRHAGAGAHRDRPRDRPLRRRRGGAHREQDPDRVRAGARRTGDGVRLPPRRRVARGRAPRPFELLPRPA